MQMKRQLYANGGIMDVTPREKFGLGSKLKKFVRKIIPNEVADIATKAAPFVAPFNPALAGVMGGLGSFDQTGSISGALKSGALNYGGGQLARYAGGAGFQGNPFGTGGAFTQGGFQGGFSSPFGTQTGIGKMLNKPIEGVGVDSGRGGTSASALSRSTANVPGGAEQFATADSLGVSSFIPEVTADAAGVTSQLTKDTILQNNPGVFDSITNSIKNFDYKGLGDKTLELGKKFGKAAFTNPDGSIDKAAVMGAIAFAGSYAEALALADDAGVELTEEQYDEATKADKQEEYAGYLTNFFGGKKDGGRIGFEGGANELIMEKLKEDTMPDTSTEDMIMIMTETGPKMIKRSDFEAMSGMFRDTTTSLYGDAARGRPVPEFANGGRIGRRFGSPEEGEKSGVMEMLAVDVDEGGDDEEDMLMAYTPGFSSQEKSYLFRRMGASGGAERSYTMPQLYRILKNPADYPEDAAVLKEIAVMGLGKKDGGRIGFAFGSPDRKTDIEEELNVDTIYRPTDKPPMLEEMPGGDKMVGMGNTMKLFETPYGFDRDRFEFMYNEYLDSGKDIPLYDFAIEFLDMVKKDTPKSSVTMAAKGGRIGFKNGTGANRVSELLILRDEKIGKGEDVSDIDAEIFQLTGKTFRSVGGISEIPTGEPRLNAGGVAERDYRQTGGFVPVGIKERADDVPAMLSKNEFVMTADAVRGIGNGSVEEGSRKLYNTMKQAEKVGKA